MTNKLSTLTQEEDLNRWNVGMGLYRWSRGMEAPIHWVCPDDGLGDPFIRKRMRSIILHGSGKANVRAFVDGRLACRGVLQATQDPEFPRRLHFPRGTTGYTVSIELWGHFDMDHLIVENDRLGGG